MMDRQEILFFILFTLAGLAFAGLLNYGIYRYYSVVGPAILERYPITVNKGMKP